MGSQRPQRAVLHLTARDAREVPWKNGRGVTRELAIWPEDASFEHGDFEWRISTSGVDAAGPFSTFAGFERLLVVTRGDGILLAHGDEAPRARLRPLEPYRFAGGWPTTCELVRGPIADFNVIWRASEWRAEVDASRLGKRRRLETIGPGHALAHVVAGRVVARVSGEEEPFELGVGESLWVQGLAQEAEIDLRGTSEDAVVLLAQIEADGREIG
jgi:environmental stress-induced protein Ves